MNSRRIKRFKNYRYWITLPLTLTIFLSIYVPIYAVGVFGELLSGLSGSILSVKSPVWFKRLARWVEEND